MIDKWYIVLVIQSLSRLWLRSPMVCITPGSSVLLCLPEFAQMPVHSQLCYLIIPPYVALFLFCPQSFPASGSFPMSWLFASGGQSTGASASPLVLPMNTQGWFPLGLTGLISLLSRDSQESFPASQFKSTKSLALRLLCGPILTSVHDYWKDHSFDHMDLCQKSDVSAFNMLSTFVILFFQGESVF